MKNQKNAKESNEGQYLLCAIFIFDEIKNACCAWFKTGSPSYHSYEIDTIFRRSKTPTCLWDWGFKIFCLTKIFSAMSALMMMDGYLFWILFVIQTKKKHKKFISLFLFWRNFLFCVVLLFFFFLSVCWQNRFTFESVFLWQQQCYCERQNVWRMIKYTHTHLFTSPIERIDDEKKARKN